MIVGATTKLYWNEKTSPIIRNNVMNRTQNFPSKWMGEKENCADNATFSSGCGWACIRLACSNTTNDKSIDWQNEKHEWTAVMWTSLRHSQHWTTERVSTIVKHWKYTVDRVFLCMCVSLCESKHTTLPSTHVHMHGTLCTAITNDYNGRESDAILTCIHANTKNGSKWWI